MKKELHPQYYPEAKVTCTTCGNAFTVGSTQPELKVEVCSNCHPFYTGKEVLMDTQGRVEKFEKKRAGGEGGREVKKGNRDAAAAQDEPKRPRTLNAQT